MKYFAIVTSLVVASMIFVTGTMFSQEINGRPPSQGSVLSKSSVTFTASPTSGPAPLGVQFYATIGNQYHIDFGDEQSASLTSSCSRPANVPGGACPPPGTYHTYTAPGTYLANLRLVTNCPQGSSCGTLLSPSHSVTITVTTGPVQGTRDR